jgi:hypothetical protein
MATQTRQRSLPALFTAAVFLTTAVLAGACGTLDNDALQNQDCPTPEAAAATTGGNSSDTSSTGASTSESGAGGSTGAGNNPSTSSGNNMPDPDPPSAKEIFARLHGCNKIRYRTLGVMLAERGGDVPVIMARSTGAACQTDNRDCTTNSQCAGTLTCITDNSLGISGKCGMLRAVNGITGMVFFPDPVVNCQKADEACYCPNGTCSGGLTTPTSNGNFYVQNPTGICLKDDNDDGQINAQDAVMAELLSFGGSLDICQKDDIGNVREFGANGCMEDAVGQPGDANYQPAESCYCPESPCFSNPNTSSGNNIGRTGFCVPRIAGSAFLFATARDAFAVDAFDSLQGEADGHTTASAVRLFDIFVMLAPSVISNISDPAKAPACTRNGNNPDMFASDGSCVEDAVSCLLGYPATDDHLLLCNLMVNKADKNDPDDVARKREIAVATLLSAVHSCE